ncbi:MAG: homoserine dehydrogenase [Acidobacteria bacterium]|nr:homoserine dehydrogenase [Acidobacteriota bacterium]
MTTRIKIGLIGLGTVGSGVVELLRDDPRFQIRRIAVRDLNRQRTVDLTGLRVTSDPFELVSDPEIDVLIEVAGGLSPARELVTAAIRSGKHVVTANKALIATYGTEIFALARHHGVVVLFEAAVAGGIPIISTLQRGLAANRITRIAGIVNGTTNYILTRMERAQLPFEAALSEAQAAGYAEADPTDDIEGNDVAYKIAILAALAFNARVKSDDIYRQGITRITDLDIRLAAEFGYRIRMIGLGQPAEGGNLDIRVHPMLIPHSHPLAGVEGVNNAIFIRGSAVGEIMLFGPGAGRLPTASAVVGDLVNLASALEIPGFCRYLQTQTDSGEGRILPIDETANAYYVRLQARDIPGVIGRLGTAFGDHQVSLHSITQKGVAADGSATIILLTHRVLERQVQGAIDQIRSQETTQEIGVVLRVLV